MLKFFKHIHGKVTWDLLSVSLKSEKCDKSFRTASTQMLFKDIKHIRCEYLCLNSNDFLNEIKHLFHKNHNTNRDVVSNVLHYMVAVYLYMLLKCMCGQVRPLTIHYIISCGLSGDNITRSLI